MTSGVQDDDSKKGPFLFVAQMDVPPELEDDFNRIYDEQHVPLIKTVPGVRACYRYKVEHTTVPTTAKYFAIYEVDDPNILQTPEWRKASDTGDWAPKIRPNTINRNHTMYRKI